MSITFSAQYYALVLLPVPLKGGGETARRSRAKKAPCGAPFCIVRRTMRLAAAGFFCGAAAKKRSKQPAERKYADPAVSLAMCKQMCYTVPITFERL